MLNLRVLYRGPLASCNYGCDYCPFAKRQETHDELEPDRRGLSQFVDWVEQNTDVRFRILFTPWGEALIRKWYQSAILRLSHLENVYRVAIQTNLSPSLAWVSDCNRDRLAFWSTFHPTETTRAAFIDKVRYLHERGIRCSVGVVGLKEHFAEIAKLKSELPESIYLWVNAYKREPDYYNAKDQEFLEHLDQLFLLNNTYHQSFGEPCDAGESSITVDGEGQIRRCHFISEPIGNIDNANWQSCLTARDCTNATCGCYIGYVNLKRLNLPTIYGDGLLERIPQLERSNVESQ